MCFAGYFDVDGFAAISSSVLLNVLLLLDPGNVRGQCASLCSSVFSADFVLAPARGNH